MQRTIPAVTTFVLLAAIPVFLGCGKARESAPPAATASASVAQSSEPAPGGAPHDANAGNPGQPPLLEPSHPSVFGSNGPSGAAGAPGSSSAVAGAANPHAGVLGIGATGADGAGALQWDAPAGWKAEAPGSPMRRAQYRLPAAAGDKEDGECVVFYFGAGQGGDASANVSRWARQFTTPDGKMAENKTSQQTIGERVVSRLEASGTYHPMSMSMNAEAPAPKPGYTLLGAVVPGGDANWFFRCTGPTKTMQANRGAFDALLASIR